MKRNTVYLSLAASLILAAASAHASQYDPAQARTASGNATLDQGSAGGRAAFEAMAVDWPFPSQGPADK